MVPLLEHVCVCVFVFVFVCVVCVGRVWDGTATRCGKKSSGLGGENDVAQVQYYAIMLAKRSETALDRTEVSNNVASLEGTLW